MRPNLQDRYAGWAWWEHDRQLTSNVSLSAASRSVVCSREETVASRFSDGRDCALAKGRRPRIVAFEA